MPADYLKPSCCFSFMSYKPPKKAMTVFVDPMRIIVWAVSLSVGVSGYRLHSVTMVTRHIRHSWKDLTCSLLPLKPLKGNHC